MKALYTTLALLLALPLASSAQEVVTRKGFHLGADLGVGNAEIEGRGEVRGAGGLRIGYGFSERFALQLYSNAIAFQDLTAGQGFLAAKVNITTPGSRNAIYVRLGGGRSQMTGSNDLDGVKVEGAAGLVGFGLDRSLGSVFLDVSLNLVSAGYDEITLNGVTFGGFAVEGEFVIATAGITFVLGGN